LLIVFKIYLLNFTAQCHFNRKRTSVKKKELNYVTKNKMREKRTEEEEEKESKTRRER